MIISKNMYIKELKEYIKMNFETVSALKKYDESRDDLIRKHMLNFMLKYCEENNLEEIKKVSKLNKQWYNGFIEEIRR